MATKQQLRTQYLAKRASLSDDAYAELNRQLLSQFKPINLTGISCINIFLPITSRREPDTLLLISWLKASHPHIQLAYPKTSFADLTIQSYADDEQLVLAESNNGITEPVKGNQIPAGFIDMVIVPLLVFDEQGYRVGYGKGFYDRFMATCKPGTQFIGLSLFKPVKRINDTDQYDIPLHQCVTPQKVWSFS